MGGKGMNWLSTALLLSATAAYARADGGDLRLSQQRGQMRITVLTSPAPLRVGPAEVSVLVQDAQTGRALVDLPVRVRLRPSHERHAGTDVPATTEAATNKLLCVAPVDFSEPGSWHIEVLVREAGEELLIAFDAEVAPAPPAWMELGLWIGWPAIAIGLFAVHQLLVYHQRQCRSPQLRWSRSKSNDNSY